MALPCRPTLIAGTLGLAGLLGVPSAAWGIDETDLEGGFPLRLEDARILPEDGQTFSVALEGRDLTDRESLLNLDIQIAQGLSEHWQVAWTGSLANIEGNSDGNVAAEALWLIQPALPERAGFGGKLELTLGQGNDNLAVELTGLASGVPAGDLWLHVNAGIRWQEQNSAGVHDGRWNLLLGASGPLEFLGGRTTAVGQLGWERSLVPGFDDPVTLEVAIRARADEQWLWFVGAGTDLSPDNYRKETIRLRAGITFDI